MAVYWAELDSSQRLSKPFAASLTMHVGILVLSMGWGLWQARQRDTFGDPNPGFGPATIETVNAIPLPNRSALPNPVARDTDAQAPTRSKPEPKKARVLDPDDPDAIALRELEKQKKKKKLTPEELRDQARQRYEMVKEKPNQVYASETAASNPMYSIKGGGGQLGMGSTNPFGTQLGWYADLIRQRVGEKWRTEDLDPRLQTAPIVGVSFRILRSGEVRDVRIIQTSGNYSLDQSTLRAVQTASPLPALPTAFTRDVANVEFRFQLRR